VAVVLEKKNIEQKVVFTNVLYFLSETTVFISVLVDITKVLMCYDLQLPAICSIALS